ncbi:MAG: hypothetical protein WKF34_08090 [Pyrinomonadaceae bacterium]
MVRKDIEGFAQILDPQVERIEPADLLTNYIRRRTFIIWAAVEAIRPAFLHEYDGQQL